MLEIIGLKEVGFLSLDGFDCPHCGAVVKVIQADCLGWCPECRNLLAFQCPYDCFWFAFTFRKLIQVPRMNDKSR